MASCHSEGRYQIAFWQRWSWHELDWFTVRLTYLYQQNPCCHKWYNLLYFITSSSTSSYSKALCCYSLCLLVWTHFGPRTRQEAVANVHLSTAANGIIYMAQCGAKQTLTSHNYPNISSERFLLEEARYSESFGSLFLIFVFSALLH